MDAVKMTGKEWEAHLARELQSTIERALAFAARQEGPALDRERFVSGLLFSRREVARWRTLRGPVKSGDSLGNAA